MSYVDNVHRARHGVPPPKDPEQRKREEEMKAMLPTKARRRDLERQAERAAEREMARIARKKEEERKAKEESEKAAAEARRTSNEAWTSPSLARKRFVPVSRQSTLFS